VTGRISDGTNPKAPDKGRRPENSKARADKKTLWFAEDRGSKIGSHRYDRNKSASGGPFVGLRAVITSPFRRLFGKIFPKEEESGIGTASGAGTRSSSAIGSSPISGGVTQVSRCASGGNASQPAPSRSTNELLADDDQHGSPDSRRRQQSGGGLIATPRPSSAVRVVPDDVVNSGCCPAGAGSPRSLPQTTWSTPDVALRGPGRREVCRR
jgi:hypothetical protein